MWKKFCTAGQVTYDDVTWRTRIAFWIPKATNKLLEYVILIDFPLQRLLQERALMLRYSTLSNVTSYLSSTMLKNNP
jgi:hypothetical protein